MNKIADAISDNKNLFEEVARRQASAISTNKRYTKYTILNYKKMLDEMCEFIDGYVSYKDKDGETYRGKVLSTTVHFYEQMFINGGKAYRMDFDITQMNDITSDYLKGSQRLQKLIETYSSDAYKDDKELVSLVALTEKQYLKLMKVYKDDMQIYLYLVSKDAKHLRKQLTDRLMNDYKNKSTPVIHEKFESSK